jgi:hypothetical protein
MSAALAPFVRHLRLAPAAVVGHMSGADLFGLVICVIALCYLLYALVRGERL